MLKKQIKKIIKFLLPKKIYSLIAHKKTYLFLQNINNDLVNKKQKKVLISYLPDFYLYDTNEKEMKKRTTLVESMQIVKYFIDKNYSIDLIHVKDKNNILKIKNKKYDIIFGFDEPFYSAARNNNSAIKIIYLTESHPVFSRKQEKLRNEYFYKRHNKKIDLERSGTYYNEKQLEVADVGILLGNEYTAKTYKDFKGEIYTISPTPLINENFENKIKNHKATKKNFLWFGSRGAIHKGLDILIDVFKDLEDLNLYVCGLNRNEKKYLNMSYSNIHDLGFVFVDTDKFIDLVNNISFVIFPSCSEGMATSVLTAMSHGLIPIITPETGIDVKDFGFFLNDYKVEEIKKTVKFCSNLSEKELSLMQKKTYNYSRKKFSLKRYSENLTKILNEII